MGIGLVTFSMTKPSADKSTGVEKDTNSIVAFNTTDNTTAINKNADSTVIANASDSSLTTETKAPEVVLEDANKNVNNLIKKYLNAKLSGKTSKFKSLVNDTKLLDIEDIARKTKYIEAYENVKSYTVNGPEEGSYIVYAYHEVKFTGIDTLAPAMNEFYVTTNKDGDPQIYLGEIDKDTEKYLSDVRNSDKVMELIYNVNDDLKKAVKKDVALAEFYLKLEESTKDVSMNN
jgi:hypothetical protein